MEQVPRKPGRARAPRGFAGYAGVLRKPEAVRAVILVLLAATSGYIDAVSYLGFGHVFTSNMTGNTVLLGLALGQGKALAAARSAVALAGYVIGVAAGSAIVDRGERRVIWPSSVTAGLAAETLVLLALAIAVIVAGPTPADALVYGLIALSAIAMGMQSVAVRALGVSGVTTTYITGTWTSLVSSLTGWLRSTLRRPREAARAAEAPPASARLQAAVVVIYMLAAVAGAAAETNWLLRAAAPPAGAVMLVLAVALWRFGQPEGVGE